MMSRDELFAYVDQCKESGLALMFTGKSGLVTEIVISS